MRLPRSFEATISRAEFLRLLPDAVANDPFTLDGDSVTGASGWRICVTKLAPRSFGGIALERQQIDLEFPDWNEAAIDTFMRRFTLFFQRGGG